MAALSLPVALVILLAEVPVENAVGIEPDLIIAGAVIVIAVLLLLRWQSNHGMDRPIMPSGEGARVLRYRFFTMRVRMASYSAAARAVAISAAIRASATLILSFP